MGGSELDLDLGETGDEVSESEEDDNSEAETSKNAEVEENTRQNALSITTTIPPPPSTSTGRYVPPHLREKSDNLTTSVSKPSNAESPSPHRRPLLGLLNRLTPTALPSLIPLFQTLFSSISRGELTPLLSSVLIEDVLAKSDQIGSGILLSLSGLIAWRAREKISGKAEVAGVVAATVERLDAEMAKGGEGKEKDNLIEFLADLVNFRVLGAELMFGFIRELVEKEGTNIIEEDVDMILKIVKVCGQQLKAEDTSSIKDIAELVATKQKSAQQSTISSRTRFMLETLEKLKTSKFQFKKGGLIDGNDSYNHIQLFLNTLDKKKPSDVPDPLNLSLESVRSAISKGQGAKWWLTGAGHIMETKYDPWNVKGESEERVLQKGKEKEKEKIEFKKLAKKQGMNTDIRERIFGVIMTSEDYVDACEKLLQRKLSETQQREIVRVLLHCCGSEKTYNPYYTLIGHRLLTRTSTKATHSFQVTMQYWLWDFFRELGEEDIGGEGMGVERTASGETVPERKWQNVAMCYAWWIAKGGLSLGIFKPLDFKSLASDSKSFLTHLFSSLFFSLQTTSPLLSINPTTPWKKDASLLRKVFETTPVLSDRKLCKGVGEFLRAYNFKPKTRNEREKEILDWSRKEVIELLGMMED
ncbi:hypothetical protein BT69DRAFT_1221363 [Atractiella rhizophila]|nr:hypothetical protein BT69DRAFT_1221363 [Atractiella rhizophila]